MDRLRASALLFFILVLGIAFVRAAEITGTIGPDENSQSGLSGTEGPEGNAYLANGTECDTNSQCYSNNCSADYDGIGKWCAASGYCAHNGDVTSYSNGSKVCSNSTTLQTCTNGIWTASTCSGSCKNGQCVSGGAATPTPTQAPGGGTGGGGGVATKPTPTPTPTVMPITPTPTPIEETVFESTKKSTVTNETIDEVLGAAGISNESEKEKAQVSTNLEFKKSIKVVKKIDPETGNETYESQFTISVSNPTNKTITDFYVIQKIPWELDGENFNSPNEYSVLSTNPFIVQWYVGTLEPNQTVEISFSIKGQVSEEEFENFSSISKGSTREIEERKGNIEVTLNDSETSATIYEPANVQLYRVADGKETLVDEKISENGIVTFSNVSVGSYVVKVKETVNYRGIKTASFSVKEGETSKVTVSLEPIKQGPVTPKPDLDALLWILLGAIAIVLLYYFRKPLLALALGKPKKKTPLEKSLEREKARKKQRKRKKARKKEKPVSPKTQAPVPPVRGEDDTA